MLRDHKDIPERSMTYRTFFGRNLNFQSRTGLEMKLNGSSRNLEKWLMKVISGHIRLSCLIKWPYEVTFRFVKQFCLTKQFTVPQEPRTARTTTIKRKEMRLFRDLRCERLVWNGEKMMFCLKNWTAGGLSAFVITSAKLLQESILFASMILVLFHSTVLWYLKSMCRTL